MPKQDSRVRQPGSMLAFVFKPWTYMVRTAVPLLLTAFLIFPESSWACRPRIPLITQYKYSHNPKAAAFIGTVVGIKPIKPSPGASWLITLKVEQDFSDGHAGDTVIVQSRESGFSDPSLAGCILSTYLDAAMGERWLVLGEREAGALVPNMHWSRRVPSAGLDAALLRSLRGLRDTGTIGR